MHQPSITWACARCPTWSARAIRCRWKSWPSTPPTTSRARSPCRSPPNSRTLNGAPSASPSNRAIPTTRAPRTSNPSLHAARHDHAPPSRQPVGTRRRHPGRVLGNLVPIRTRRIPVEINGKDAAGTRSPLSTTLDVLGDKEAEWGYRNAWQVQLVPDRAEYHAGDKATILVKTPISGRALVSVEREGVSRSFVTELRKEHPAIEVPGDCTATRRTCSSPCCCCAGSDAIAAPDQDAGIPRGLLPTQRAEGGFEACRRGPSDQPDYQPGNEVSVQVNVTDEAHRPAAGAEVTLYAVDKGVLSLTGYSCPDLEGVLPRPAAGRAHGRDAAGAAFRRPGGHAVHRRQGRCGQQGLSHRRRRRGRSARPPAAEFRRLRVLERHARHGCPGTGRGAFHGPR